MIDRVYRWLPLAATAGTAAVCFAVCVWASRVAGRTDGLGRLTNDD